MRISNSSMKKIAYIINEPFRILKCLFIGPVINPTQNNFFNFDLENIFEGYKNISIEENKTIQLKSGDQHMVFHFDKINIHNTSIDFSEYTLEEKQRFFIFSNIYSEGDINAIFRLGTNCKIKIWLNNRLIYAGYTSLFENNFIIGELKDGNNSIVVELQTTDREEGKSLSMYVSKYNIEANQIENEIINEYIAKNVKNEIHIINESFFFDDNLYSFSIIPMDFCNVDIHQVVRVNLYDSKENLINCIDVKFYQLNSIKTNNLDQISLNVIYYDILGNKLVKNYEIINNNSLKSIKEKVRFYEKTLLKMTHDSSQDTYLTGLLNDLKVTIVALENKNAINNIERERVLIKRYLRSKKKLQKIVSSNNLLKTVEELLNEKDTEVDVYYKSELDNSLKKFLIRHPKVSSTAKKYPLIIYILPLIEYYGSEGAPTFNELFSNEVIYAAVCTRNVTLGSYIGEVSILECVSIIQNKFNVDETRIYLIGYSNGAYACWSMAQAYPHVFAAIAPLSGGFYEKNIDNLASTPFFACYGENDGTVSLKYCNILNSWLKERKTNETNQIISFSGSTHWAFVPIIWSNSVLISWLLKQKKELYSKKSYFRTENIHHNGNEWIRIINVGNKAEYASVSLQVNSNSYITIEIHDVQDFELNLPDYLNTNITLAINSQEISISKDDINNCLYFSKFNSEYHLVNEKPIKNKSFWGMGILDVYLDKLNIIAPSSFVSSNEESIIMKIAQSLSQPKSMGYDPNISVKYPILNDFTMEEAINNSNIILIGCNNNNQLLNKFKEKLKIELTDDGYYYRNKFHLGEYSIIFIQHNPLNEDKSMLVVYSNSLKVLKKTVFLRKFIIPAYFNGFHPYLNAELIIFDGKSMLVANSLEDELYSP